MKSPLLILGTLLVIALFTALIVPFFIDWSQYRSDIEEYGRKLTGREVKIAGDIDIRLLPLPKLTLGRISIANMEGAQAPQLMSARQLDARLSLSPLLRGKLQVTSIVLEEPVFDLERMQNGSGNWWLSPRINLAEVAKIDEISLQAVQLSNATFFMRDARRDSVARFDNGELRISAVSLSGPVNVRGALSYNDEPIEIAINSGKRRPDGSMRLHVRLKPQTGMRLIYNFDGQLTGKASGEVARGKLRIVPPAVEDALKGDRLSVIERLPFEFTTQVKVFEESVAFEKIDFALDKKNRITNALTGQAIVSLDRDISLRGQFEARRLDFDILKSSLGEGIAGDVKQILSIEAADEVVKSMPSGFSAALSVGSDQLLSGGETIEDAKIALSVSAERIKLENLAGILPGRTNFKMNGLYLPDEKTPQFIGEIGLDALDGRTLANWFRPGMYKDGEGNVGRLTMAGKLTATPAQVRVTDGQFSFDGGAGTGGLSWARSGPPTIDVSIKSEKLDFNSVLYGDEGLASLPRLIDNLAGDGAAIGLDVRAGSVALGSNTFSRFAADVTFSSDAINIREFSARLENEGSFVVNGELMGRGKNIRGLLSGSIDAADGAVVEALLGKVSLPPYLHRFLASGAVDLVGELETGPSMSRIEASGIAAGGSLNARLVANGGLGSWEKSELTFNGEFSTANAAVLLGVLEVDAKAESGSAQVQIEAEGSFAEGLKAAVSGNLFGAGFNTRADLKSSNGAISGTGNLDIAADDGSRLLNALGVNGASVAPLDVKVKLFARENIFSNTNVDADFLFADSAGKISGSLGVDGPRQKFSGNVSMTRLDLPAVLGAVLLKENEQSNSTRAQDWSGRLFRGNALGLLDSELSIKADNLRLIGDVRLASASFIAGVSNGALEVSALTGRMGDGSYDGGFKLAPANAGARKFSATFSLQNVDAERWLSGTAGDALAQGKVSLSGTLKADGRSPAGLVSILSGTGRWSAGEAKLNGIDAGGLQAGLKEVGVTLTVDDLVAKRLKSGSFSFGPVEGDWSVSSGLLRFAPVQIESPQANARMSVFADLPTRKLDASWALKLPGFDDLPEFVIALAGPFGDLQRSYDTSALKSYLVVRELKQGVDRLEELQAEQQRIYEEQKRLEEEENARRLAEKKQREAEEAARKAAEDEAQRVIEEEAQRKAEQEARLEEEREARRQLEAELHKQEAEQKAQEAKKAAQQAEEKRKIRAKAERERQKKAEEAAQKSQDVNEQPLLFDNSGTPGLPLIITPENHGVIRRVLPPIDNQNTR